MFNTFFFSKWKQIWKGLFSGTGRKGPLTLRSQCSCIFCVPIDIYATALIKIYNAWIVFVFIKVSIHNPSVTNIFVEYSNGYNILNTFYEKGSYYSFGKYFLTDIHYNVLQNTWKYKNSFFFHYYYSCEIHLRSSRTRWHIVTTWFISGRWRQNPVTSNRRYYCPHYYYIIHKIRRNRQTLLFCADAIK